MLNIAGKTVRNNKAPRILLSVLGAALILMGAGYLLLGFVGERSSAVVTSVRREGGERSDGRPGRYTYSIGYTFTLPDGGQVDGNTRRISDAVYLKADGSSRIPIRYIDAAPFINAAEEDTTLSFGQPILIISGAFLIVIINRKKQPGRKKQIKIR